MTKRWIKVCAGILAIVGIVLVSWLAWLALSRKRFENYLASLQERGIAMSPEDFLKDVPDAENAWIQFQDTLANAPLVLESSLSRTEDLMNAMQRPGTMSKDVRAALLTFPSSNTVLLEGLHRVEDCSEFGFPRSALGGEPAWRWPFADKWDFVKLKQAYQALFASSAVLADEGNLVEALDLWKLGVRSSRPLREQGETLLEVMTGIAFASNAIESISSIVRRSELNEWQARLAMNTLEPSGWREALVNALFLECATYLHALSQPRMGEANKISGPGYIALPLYYKANMQSNDEFLRAISAMRLEPWVAIPQLKMINSEISHFAQGPLGKFSFPKVAMPNLFKAYETITDRENCFQIIRIALASRLFYEDRHSWPDSLEDVAPEILPEIPVDLFTGEPFHYNLEDGGVVIYTTGPNGVDEGGNNDDWAWRQSAPVGMANQKKTDGN